jgi:hypothetical protein
MVSSASPGSSVTRAYCCIVDSSSPQEPKGFYRDVADATPRTPPPCCCSSRSPTAAPPMPHASSRPSASQLPMPAHSACVSSAWPLLHPLTRLLGLRRSSAWRSGWAYRTTAPSLVLGRRPFP